MYLLPISTVFLLQVVITFAIEPTTKTGSRPFYTGPPPTLTGERDPLLTGGLVHRVSYSPETYTREDNTDVDKGTLFLGFIPPGHIR